MTRMGFGPVVISIKGPDRFRTMNRFGSDRDNWSGSQSGPRKHVEHLRCVSLPWPAYELRVINCWFKKKCISLPRDCNWESDSIISLCMKNTSSICRSSMKVNSAGPLIPPRQNYLWRWISVPWSKQLITLQNLVICAVIYNVSRTSFGLPRSWSSKKFEIKFQDINASLSMHKGNIQHIIEYTQKNRPVPHLSEDWLAVLHDEWTFVY